MSDNPTLDILMITYNRPEYTRLALPRLLESCGPGMRVWVWHNGDHQPTLDAVKACATHPRFHQLEISPENKGQREPTNWLWLNSRATYVSKVDDDCLLPDGWGETLMRAHEANPELGAIGCSRFFDEDIVPELTARKVVPLRGGHRLMRSCWVQGSGFVMKRALVERHGGRVKNESFPQYCVRTALQGWQHGWYFPFIHEEHMDDPRSPFCRIKTDADLVFRFSATAQKNNVSTIAEWTASERKIVRQVLSASLNPRDHVGWRRRIANVKRRLRRLAGAKGF